MIDLQKLRSTIESAAPGGQGAIVSRSWLEEVERELMAGNLARNQLAMLSGLAAVTDCLGSGVQL